MGLVGVLLSLANIVFWHAQVEWEYIEFEYGTPDPWRFFALTVVVWFILAAGVFRAETRFGLASGLARWALVWPPIYLIVVFCTALDEPVIVQRNPAWETRGDIWYSVLWENAFFELCAAIVLLFVLVVIKLAGLGVIWLIRFIIRPQQAG